MIDSVLTFIAAITIPLVGLVLQASPRTRLRNRSTDLLRLAAEIEAHDAQAAEELRTVAGKTAIALAQRDRRALSKKIDPSTLVGTALLAAPGIGAVVAGTRWDNGLAWMLIGAGALWVVLVIAAVWQHTLADDEPGHDRA